MIISRTSPCSILYSLLFCKLHIEIYSCSMLTGYTPVFIQRASPACSVSFRPSFVLLICERSERQISKLSKSVSAGAFYWIDIGQSTIMNQCKIYDHISKSKREISNRNLSQNLVLAWRIVYTQPTYDHVQDDARRVSREHRDVVTCTSIKI